MEDYSALIELENLYNEAWTNGYIDGYISIIRKGSENKGNHEEYVGPLLEEYESGYLSALKDDSKWTGKYAWAQGFIDGNNTSKLEWIDFGYYAFWMPVYTGELLKKYNEGYYEGFYEGYRKQKKYEWAWGYLNQLRSLYNQHLGKNYHDDHGKLFYPIAYEEGYEVAKTFIKFNSLYEAEKAIKFTREVQWIIGYIDGKYHRKELFGKNRDNMKPKQSQKIFDEYSYAYNEGYEVGSGSFPYWKNKQMGMDELEWHSSSITIERSEKQINEEHIWGIGYIKGRSYETLNYRGYSEIEKEIYKAGYDYGYSELKQEKTEKIFNESISLRFAELTGEIDAINHKYMTNHGYDRFRFHAYRKGFYREMEYQFKLEKNWEKGEEDPKVLFKYIKSFQIPPKSDYISSQLEAWKLGVKSGFTGNSPFPNKVLFFYNEDNSYFSKIDDYYACNIESDLYEAYKKGCKFGYKHTFLYRWDSAYEIGYSDGCDFASSDFNNNVSSRDNYKGFELEAYDKGFSDGIAFIENRNQKTDDYYDPTNEWTIKESYDVMTDGMYGDINGDLDFDKLGF